MALNSLLLVDESRTSTEAAAALGLQNTSNQPQKAIEPVKRPQRASALAATKRVTDFAAQQAQSNEVRCLCLRWRCLQANVDCDLFCFIWFTVAYLA